MKKMITIILLLGAMFTSTLAQSVDDFINEGKRIVNKATVQFDKVLYLKARGLFERALSSDPENRLAKYYLAYTDYRLAIYFMSEGDDVQFERFINSGMEMCESLLADDNNDAETKALLGGIYGIRIANDGSLGPTLGPESNMLLYEAVELEPDNPRVLVFAGISKLNTPEFFGGSKKKALEYFTKAVELFESGEDVNPEGIDWGYTDALAWQGKAFMELGKYQQAVDVFKKALGVEPDFVWVKHKLLPEAEEKLNTAK